MAYSLRPVLAVCVSVALYSGCEKKDNSLTPAARELIASGEHLDATQVALAAKVTPGKDPIAGEIAEFCRAVRQAFVKKDFEWLEKTAREACDTKATFGNGSWKIYQFYDALELGDGSAESAWLRDERAYRDWMAAQPDSLTACIAAASFQINFGWHARGDGYADSVTAEGWRLFRERLDAADALVDKAHGMKGHDPEQWLLALLLARGQKWPLATYEAVVEQAHAYEPTFWGYEVERAVSLLPRWYGRAGDWEAYADKAADRPDGLGDEVYARIVINLRGYHGNIFRESHASWPRTLKGLELMRERYPKSMEIVSEAAYLAATQGDRPTATRMFALMGQDYYLPEVWRRPEQFAHVQHWVQTGQW